MAEPDDVVAVMVTRSDGVWVCDRLSDRFTDDLDSLVETVRGQESDVGPLLLVDVEGEFFVAVRRVGARVSLLLSDVTAGAAWDLAADVLDELEVPVPDEDEMDEVWPVGDLSMLVDLGMDELALGAVLADVDAYADEQLLTIARTCGFEPAWRGVNAAALR